MAIRLRKHHRAWLRAHPHRDEAWFLERLRDGFDVHHVDGDDSNDCPLNLVLIEHTDHMALHGGFYMLGRLSAHENGGKRVRSKRRQQIREHAKEAAMARAAEGITWREAARRFGVTESQAQSGRRWLLEDVAAGGNG